MKLEIRSHFWPNTPNLREIKIVVDGKVIISSFMNADEIFEFANSLDGEIRKLFDEAACVKN